MRAKLRQRPLQIRQWSSPSHPPSLAAEALPRLEGLLWAVRGRGCPAHLAAGDLLALFPRSIPAAHTAFVGPAVLLADFIAVFLARRVLELAGLISLGLAQSAECRNAQCERQ